MPPKRIQDLSWDAFPEPPPEAATWKPDPAYIAAPGQLKDPRFNKDPYEAARLKAARKDYGYQLRHSSEAGRMSLAAPLSNGSGSNDLNAGKWPPQVRRHGEPERSLSVSAPSSCTLEPANAEHRGQRGRTMHVQAEESVENFEVKPLESHSSMTLPKRVAASKSKSPAKTLLPAWAGPLEKALAEDTSKGSVLPTQTEVKSVPPHLRKISQVISTKTSSDRRLELHPVTKHQPALLDPGASVGAVCETTWRVPGSNISAPSAMINADLLRREALAANMTTPSAIPKDSEDHANIKEMLADFDDDQHHESVSGDARYRSLGHYLKLVLVLAMKKDIWEHELLKLGEKELDDLMLSLSSKHEQLWESKHGRGNYSQNGVGNNVLGQ